MSNEVTLINELFLPTHFKFQWLTTPCVFHCRKAAGESQTYK
jgi:hypothetical protein